MKPPKLQGSENFQVAKLGTGRVECPERVWKLHTPSPYLALYIYSTWLFLSYNPCIKSLIVR